MDICDTLQPVEFVVSASIGALLVVAVAVLRIYLGWAYVGDRLLSAAVEYEETGWYDGQVRGPST
jgi:Conserved in the green lineage and diatoms 27